MLERLRHLFHEELPREFEEDEITKVASTHDVRMSRVEARLALLDERVKLITRDDKGSEVAHD